MLLHINQYRARNNNNDEKVEEKKEKQTIDLLSECCDHTMTGIYTHRYNNGIEYVSVSHWNVAPKCQISRRNEELRWCTEHIRDYIIWLHCTWFLRFFFFFFFLSHPILDCGFCGVWTELKWICSEHMQCIGHAKTAKDVQIKRSDFAIDCTCIPIVIQLHTMLDVRCGRFVYFHSQFHSHLQFIVFYASANTDWWFHSCCTPKCDLVVQRRAAYRMNIYI